MNDNKPVVPFNLKTTPLFEILFNAGGSFTEFGGYYMPVNFRQGIISEHQEVRNNVGFFDISHMGEIRIKGKEAPKFLNYVSTNNIYKCANNQMQYQIICLNDGGVVDDMMAYRFEEDDLLLVCNASNKDVLFKHLSEVLKKTPFDCQLIDESDSFAAIAVQGPNSQEVLNKALNMDLGDLKFLKFKDIEGFIISRSGYTGEDGFEVYGSGEKILALVKVLLDNKVMPCGLGSRDTLRFEAGLPLFGHELSNYITPVQAGLFFAIDFNKENFIGKKALLKQKEEKPETKIYGMELLERGVARQGYKIYDLEEVVGYVTSGFMIPGTKNSYANGLIKASYKIGDVLEIEIRNKRIKAQIRKKRYIK